MGGEDPVSVDTPLAHQRLYKSRETSRQFVAVYELLVQRLLLQTKKLERGPKPGGLGVGSSNLPAPTNEIKGLENAMGSVVQLTPSF